MRAGNASVFIFVIKPVLEAPSIVAFIKRYPEIMQQIYRRAPMPKCDFNKVALQFYWNNTSAWVFSCKFAAYFQHIFS